jgi:flotillin
MAYDLKKKTMEIQVQEQEIQRKEKELDATIKRQADAKRYEIETLAEAERKRIEAAALAEKSRLTTVAEGEKARGLAAADVARAQGEAQAAAEKARGLADAAIKEAQGLAEGEARKAQGLAEAMAMEKKAEAWRKYNEAAVLQILAPILPEIARAIAEPLTKIDRITLVNTGGNGEVGVSRMTSEVARVISQVPPVIESLTGMKVDQLLDRLRSQPASPPAPSASSPAPELKRDGGTEAPPLPKA